jgi:hypothetical protein
MRASIIEGCTSAPDIVDDDVVVAATASFDISENGRALVSGGEDDINAIM